MLVSRKLLNRYVDIKDISTLELSDTLTNAGLEVEGIEELVSGSNLVVGFVESCVQHEDSDHLNICKVNVGDEILPIVCGADNVAAGQKVIVAKVGAVLDGDFEIKATQIRGQESLGMICSLGELGIPEKFHPEAQAGIFVLDQGEIGQDAIEALGMRDEIMDIKQTPNRSDFMALSSIAKEVAALFKVKTTLPNFDSPKIKESKTELKLNLKTDLSKQFLGKVVNHLEIKPSPAWIQEALIASGMRPINNIVDISNIVMLETGQPIHFYDKDFLSPLEISVVDNFEGSILALDDETYNLQKGDQVIMNGKTPIGIAGIMGLENSMIMDDTKSIVIEVASFDRVAVRHTSSRLGISSEASTRFSKPMDPQAPFQAMSRALSLLIEYAGASDFEETVQAGCLKEEVLSISTSLKRINDLLGTDFSLDQVVDVFERLNFKPQIDDEDISVSVPSYRRDLFIPEDLTEEVIRVLGFDTLPETLPKMDLTSGRFNERQRMIRHLEKMTLAYGANQIVSYSLVDQAKTQGVLSIGSPIKLLSPLSDKRAYLRTHLLPSMMEILAYNNARKNDKKFYFEESRIYTKEKRQSHYALLGEGTLFEETWLKDSIKLDFFYLKGIFLEMMNQLGFQEARFRFEAFKDESQTFNPYQSAKIFFGRHEIGLLGHLHPNYAGDFDLEDPVYLEVNLESILSSKKASIKSLPLSKHHEITRDMAVLVDQDISNEALVKTMTKAAKRTVSRLSVFDVFESQELGDKKSLAYKLKFDGEKIQSSKEIQKIMDSIEAALINEHQAIIR